MRHTTEQPRKLEQVKMQRCTEVETILKERRNYIIKKRNLQRNDRIKRWFPDGLECYLRRSAEFFETVQTRS